MDKTPGYSAPLYKHSEVVEHEAQLLNYLKATPFEVGLLLNFGPKPETKRRSFDNTRKEWWLARHKT